MNDMVTRLCEERSGWKLVINDSEELHLSVKDARSLALAEGEEIDLEALKKQLLVQQYPEALHRAVGYLATRAHSTFEIEQKLEQRRYLPDTIEMVVYRLQKEKLLDDEAFAKAWAQSRANRQMGRMRILQELRQKGIDRETAEAALADIDAEAGDEAAVELALKLLRRYDGEDAATTMRKAVQAMQRRGYGYSDAGRALQAAIERMSEEDE